MTILLGFYIADFFSLLNGGQGKSEIHVESSHSRDLDQGAKDSEIKQHDSATFNSNTERQSIHSEGRDHRTQEEHHEDISSNRESSEGHNNHVHRTGSNNTAPKEHVISHDEHKSDIPKSVTSDLSSGGPPSPMNRAMENIQVPANTGKLSMDQVKDYYRRLVKAYLAPFTNGIYRQLFFEILRRRTYSLTPPGGNKGIQSILFQIIDSKVYILDPYDVPKNTKPFYRSRINEMIWLLSRLAGEGRIKDTEFLVSIHDCVQTVNKPHTYRGAHHIESSPTFTIVSCNFSDNIPFPMWEGGDERGGGLAGWDRKMEQYSIDITKWDLKSDKAVFRGGNRPSMYFQDKMEADKHCHDVGRTRLQYLGEEHSDLLDVSVGGTCAGKHKFLKRLATMEHHKYKYILYAEGNCFWADRLNKQLYGPSTIIKQETPCGQFFEPLLKPMTHYIPTDFFFADTLEKVRWAREHDGEAKEIVANANQFATNFLTLAGIESYVEVLLDEYRTLLVDPHIKLENGAVEVTNKRV